jgi:hypothetical protein
MGKVSERNNLDIESYCWFKYKKEFSALPKDSTEDSNGLT